MARIILRYPDYCLCHLTKADLESRFVRHLMEFNFPCLVNKDYKFSKRLKLTFLIMS